MIFWMLPDSGLETSEVMEGFLKDFCQQHPDIDLDVQVINRRTLWNKIFTLKHDIGKEGCPDLIAFPHYWTSILATAKLLEPLQKFDKDITVSHVLDPLRPHCFLNDTEEIYSFPWWLDITALHYREDHLKAVTSKPEEALSTWQGMLDICKELRNYFNDVDDYYPVQNSDWRGSLSHRSVLPCLWSKGAFLFSKDLEQSGLSMPAFQEGMQSFIDLALKGYMPILRERSSIGNISAGKSSLIITRRQNISMFEGAQFKVQTLPIPKTGAQSVNYLGAINLGILRKSQESEAAYKLLKWLAQPEKQIAYAAKIEAFPSYDGAFENFLIASPERVKKYTNIISSARTLPNHIVTGAVMEIMANMMGAISSAILMRKYTPKLLTQELKKADRDVQEILRLYKD